MDPDAEPTQQATQDALDPRRLGKQNSGFSDEELADIICILIPSSGPARREVSMIARESSQHMVARDDADNVELDLDLEDEEKRFDLAPRKEGEQAIALRMSAQVKCPLLGFTFGRNAQRCDICFLDDPLRRLSNIHFRIYLNEYGVLMLEDHSTNGTLVDGNHLKAKTRPRETKRTLSSGSSIRILMHSTSNDLSFLVRIPRREGQYELAYRQNLCQYMHRQRDLEEKDRREDPNRTICPGPGGHVDLFHQQQNAKNPHPLPPAHPERLHRAWNGSDKYHRVGEIGKGAFATVYRVTHKFDGIPYAAKELDKRKFMKNGVLDQKVENEMNIMQRVQHPNIVRYIEHLDWDDRLLIIIMEYVPGGDLGRLVHERGPLTEEAVQIMARQLLEALGYLHENNITHRDVKPDNILIGSHQPFVVKLTDFGLSKMVDNEQTFLRTFCGTLLYCAPEVYAEFAEYDDLGRRNPRNRQRKHTRTQRYDHAVDIWSLGGVLFYALTGEPPFPVKTGISYSELLHRIMTTPLDVSPLQAAGISNEGINFLRRMLDRRPETRAAIRELEEHPWLCDTSVGKYLDPNPDPDPDQSDDEISDDGLEQGASQLSLDDNRQQLPSQRGPETFVEGGSINDENRFGGFDSQKENFSFGFGNQQQRLFGEVNASALGSSGLIPHERLNLPVSDASLGATVILGASEIRDSFESDSSSTPRQQKSQKSQPSPGGALRLSALSAGQSKSVGHLNNMTFDVDSQSLGGAESILENLNMRSLAGSNLRPHDVDYFNSSKRKNSSSLSDESEDSTPRNKPIIKRFKSGGPADASIDDLADEKENELFACIPPVARARSTRQVDKPVEKSVYWNPQDRKSWHLRYPEMTKFQLDAFETAAEARGEEFGPGKSALWDLAMKYFPPTHYEEIVREPALDVENFSNDDRAAPRHGDRKFDELDSNYLPSTAGSQGHAGGDDGEGVDLPGTLLPRQSRRIVPLEANPPGKRIVATLQSSPESIVKGISIFVTDSMVSWGRAPENTRVYDQSKESRVPKYAFRIVLWKDGYDPAKDSRPWNQNNKAQDSFYFYISTKATQGIHINNVTIHSHDPKNPVAPSKYWLRLHDGDRIIVWQNGDAYYTKTELVFHCAWGGSSKPRSRSTSPGSRLPPPPLVSDSAARKLDEVCIRAEKKMKSKSEYDLKIEESRHDHEERIQTVDQERERSRAFELRRQEICRVLDSRKSRKISPASMPPPPGPGLVPASGIGSGAARASPGLGLVSGNRTAFSTRRISPRPADMLRIDR